MQPKARFFRCHVICCTDFANASQQKHTRNTNYWQPATENLHHRKKQRMRMENSNHDPWSLNIHQTNLPTLHRPIGILAHRTSEDDEGVYNHLWTARYLGSMKPFSEGEPGSLGDKDCFLNEIMVSWDTTRKVYSIRILFCLWGSSCPANHQSAGEKKNW